jgi:hypothetical protein
MVCSWVAGIMTLAPGNTAKCQNSMVLWNKSEQVQTQHCHAFLQDKHCMFVSLKRLSPKMLKIEN